METHYLIDYENDGKNGLKGCETLTSSDFIHLFYTDHSKNTTFDIFTNHGKAELDIKKVPVGEQSLDKHLIAYLGYLVGKNAGIKTKCVIISSDKGYDNVCEFLREEFGNSTSVSRRSTIAVKQSAQKNETKQNADKKNRVSKENPTRKTKRIHTTDPDKKVDANNKVSLHNEIQKILSKANAGQDVIAYVPGLAIKHCDKKNAMQTIYGELIKKFGQNKGLDIYNRIKNIVRQHSHTD